MALKLLVSVVNTVVGARRDALDRFFGLRAPGGGAVVDVIGSAVVVIVVAGDNGTVWAVVCEDEGKK